MRFAFKHLIVAMIIFGSFVGDLPATEATDSIFSEIRIGWLAHDIDAVSFNREDGSNINAELLFTPLPLEIFHKIGSPRPHLGTSINSHGDTSQIYAGFTWQWKLPNRFFIEAMFGGAFHDGNTDLETSDRKALGSKVLFRLGTSLGYHINEHINISILFDHISNAYLKEENEGMDNLGIRIGYRF